MLIRYLAMDILNAFVIYTMEMLDLIDIFRILHLKKLEKGHTKSKVSRRKEIVKIRAKINEMETKKQCKRSTKLKSGSLKDKPEFLSWCSG